LNGAGAKPRVDRARRGHLMRATGFCVIHAIAVMGVSWAARGGEPPAPKPPRKPPTCPRTSTAGAPRSRLKNAESTRSTKLTAVATTGRGARKAHPGRSQIAAIEIRDEDAISDSGVEIWNLLESRGISHYTGHHANELKPKVTTAKGAESHPIMAGVQTPFTGQGSLYKTGPLAASARALLLGEIAGHPVEPVAWVNLVGSSQVFYTSLGHPGDFDYTAFRRLLRNAVFWAMNRQPSGGLQRRFKITRADFDGNAFSHGI